MFWYIYYGYSAYRYAYLIEYGYTTVQYAGKVYTWVVPPENDDVNYVDRDWVMCDVDSDSEGTDEGIIVLD